MVEFLDGFLRIFKNELKIFSEHFSDLAVFIKDSYINVIYLYYGK